MTEWATLTAGVGTAGAGTFTTPAQVDAGAQTVNQANINLALPTFTGAFAANANVRQKTDSGFLITQPTTVAASVLKATLRNNAGDNILSFTVTYDFGVQVTTTTETAPGQRVFWSLSGAPNTWNLITNFSGLNAAATVSATLNVAGWANGTDMYLLWLDDNAATNPDGGYSIDNFAIAGVVTGAIPCPGITVGPANISRQQCFDSAASFSITATGAVAGVQWYRQEPGGGGFNAIAGAGGNSYTLPSYTVAGDNGAQFRAVVTNSAGCSVTSSVATLTVVADTTPPSPLFAITYDIRTNRAANTLTNLTVVFSEPINTNNADLWTNWTLTDTNTGTQVPLLGQVYLNSTTVLLETDSASGGVIDPTHGYTIELQLVFDTCANLEMPLITIPVKSFQNTILEYDASTIWRYNQDNVDLGTAWRAPGFDDSAWATGAAVFDAKTAAGQPGSCSARTMIAGEPIRTCLSLSNATATAEIPTYYFRKQFNYSGDVNAILALRAIVDDGMVVYLNGAELFRLRMPAGTIGFTTPSAGAAIGDASKVNNTNYVAATLLNGVNTIAVEVHNVNLTGSDITFALAVDAITATQSAVQPVMSVSRSGGQTTVSWNPPIGTLQYSLDIGNPANWVTIPGASSPFVTNAPPAIQFFRVTVP